MKMSLNPASRKKLVFVFALGLSSTAIEAAAANNETDKNPCPKGQREELVKEYEGCTCANGDFIFGPTTESECRASCEAYGGGGKVSYPTGKYVKRCVPISSPDDGGWPYSHDTGDKKGSF